MWPRADRTSHSARSSTWLAPCSAISSTNSFVIGATEPKLTPIRIGVPRSFAQRHHLADVLFLADVAGIQPQAVDTGFERLQRQRVLEMDVGDERHRRMRHDIRQRRRRLAVRNGDADDLAADVGQFLDLGEGRLRVAGIGGGHRLHADRVFATEGDVTDVQDAGLPAWSKQGHGEGSPWWWGGAEDRGWGTGTDQPRCWWQEDSCHAASMVRRGPPDALTVSHQYGGLRAG